MWEAIKKVLQKQGGICIIVEDGKPSFVVSSFEEYENLLDKDLPKFEKAAPVVFDTRLLEKINQEIENWKAGQAEAQAEAAAVQTEEEVKIEDLPI